MNNKEAVQKIKSVIQKGIVLSKCKKCGCMKEVLGMLRYYPDLIRNICGWQEKMETVEYVCLGCTYCYAAVAMNIFNQVFPKESKAQSLCNKFKERRRSWPVVWGDYFAACKGYVCPVAVSTLANSQLAERLAKKRPKALCIVGKTETENIGIDKVIKNVITNPTIRFLILAGKDSRGHWSGRTLFALWKKSVDKDMRVMGSPGRNPVLRNVTPDEIGLFRKQVQVVDMIGCEDEDKIISKIEQLSQRIYPSQIYRGIKKVMKPIQIPSVATIQAKSPQKVKLDKSGYFVIIPLAKHRLIVVEHYSYGNKLLHSIEGKDARSIYSTIIENGWVKELSHAAYLGKELARTELSIRLGFKYIQDKA